MGKPIVSTNIIEIIEDEVNGILVPPKDSCSLEKKIIKLLNNEEYAKKMGANAQIESKKYDVNAYMRRLEKIYEGLIYKTKK